jgi:hypothetical protein
MTTLDLAKMQEIANESHAVAVAKCFGPAGPRTLRALTEMITRLYKNIEPAQRTQPLLLFMRPPQVSPFAPTAATATPQHEVSDPDHAWHELNPACIVEVTDTGQLKVFEPDAFDPEDLSSEAIVYTYHDGVECFVIDRVSYTIINPAPTHASVFARPTFSSLAQALEDYRTGVARNTTCFILADAWSDGKRLFLCAKPEWIMRRSLHQYLRTIFPDAEVRPESVVDESHPVDIKITWSDTNRRALIEIKWLGQSRDQNGRFTTAYTAHRAREGAKQLADYLDADHTAGPGLRTRGYLVVFDARRRALTETINSVNADDGLYFRDAEIEYQPAYHELREDFEPPIRMFAEPVLN